MEAPEYNKPKQPARAPELRSLLRWTFWFCVAAALLIRFPHEVSYWMLALAEKASLEGRTEEALAWIERAKPWTPESSLPLKVLGSVKQKAGQLDELGRIDLVLQADLLASQRASLHLKKSEIFQKRGRWKDAIAEFDEAANYDGDLRPSLARLELLMLAGEDKQAQREIDQLLKAASSDDEKAALLQQISGVYQRRSRWDEAIRAFDEAAQIKPELRPSIYRLELLLLAGRHKDAKQQLAEIEQALEKSWESKANIHNTVAYYSALIGADLEQALERAEQAVAAEQNNAAYLDTRAYVQYRLKNYDQALLNAQQAVKLSEKDFERLQDNVAFLKGLAVMVYHRSLIYDALGKSAEAERDRDRVRHLGFEPDQRLF